MKQKKPLKTEEQSKLEAQAKQLLDFTLKRIIEHALIALARGDVDI